MFFDYTDKRTPAERERDLRLLEERRTHGMLARGMLDKVSVVLADKGFRMGLVGTSSYGDDGEVLFENDGITYSLRCRVERDE